VDAVIAMGSLPRATVRSFPFHCGHVTSMWKTVSFQFHKLEEAGDLVCLYGCGCSNTLDIPLGSVAGSSLISHAAGASLFLPDDLVNSYEKNGAMVILPGWLFRWKQNVQCDKLDQTTARLMYTESIKEIILLDTGTHPGTLGILKEFIEFIGVPGRVLPVGIEYFRLRLMELYLKWEREQEIIGCRTEVRTLEKKVADYSMLADLTTKIIGARGEKTVIFQMLDLFVLLCSPKRVEFLPFREGVYQDIICIPQNTHNQETGQIPFPDPSIKYMIAKTGDGFRFRVMYGQQMLGILSIDGLLLPEYLDEYLNLAHFISQVAGLSITIARTYEDLERIVAEREAEIVERRKIEEALSEANKKLNLLSSVTRHDIKNKVITIQGFLRFARKTNDIDTIQPFLDKIQDSAKAIEHQIDFSKIYHDLGVNSPKWLTLSNMIILAGNPALHITDETRTLQIFADPLFEKVLHNLADNTIRHGENATEVHVFVITDKDDIRIIWEDNGVGVPADQKEMIFQRGFGKNTGLGLFLIREILSITGMTIRETGEPGKCARFEITVPNGKWRYGSEGCRRFNTKPLSGQAGDRVEI